MLSQLAPRERQIVDVLYIRGAGTVAEVRDALPDALSASAVRAMLTRLEAKGFVARRASDRGIEYRPTTPKGAVEASALRQVVDVFFNGSATSAASALLGMAGRLDEADLSALERLIAAHRGVE